MHIPDLSRDGKRIAVGWLHPDHPFPQGDVPPDFLDKLKRLCRLCGESAEALNWGACGGVHECEFCGKALGACSFGVPGSDVLFYAPDMIGHYVEAHRYQPPQAFIAAVLASPIPGTREYQSAVEPFIVRY